QSITGPTKNVRFYRATPAGGGAISKSEDGLRCAVTGREWYKSALGRGGYRIDSSRNFWEGSGLKIDSASTDVAWAPGIYNNKILTSARNGELIMWDINKAGFSKYERRSKDHLRSINAMAVSQVVHGYCITGSADGDLRVWDFREMLRSAMRVHHPTSVRSVAFSPSILYPLCAIAGLDNGSIYRWDLKMGQRGLLDRIPVAHAASVTSLDWRNHSGSSMNLSTASTVDSSGSGGMGWLVSGGLDRCVKVWDLTAPNHARIPNKPTYTLHPSFPVRRVMWRPSYDCEVAIVSNAEFSTGSNADLESEMLNNNNNNNNNSLERKPSVVGGDAVEIWDVRRGWIPKWSVMGSAIEGGVTDFTFSNPDMIWTQSSSGTFAQIDLRNSIKPLDAMPTSTTTWESSGTLTFATDTKPEWQIPYDDIPADRRVLAEKQGIRVKALGDTCYVPALQNVGTFNPEPPDDVEVFNRLAREYIFHGEDRPTICAINARVAFQAHREELAQTWLLLGASLADMVPTPTTPLSPIKASSSVQPTPHVVTSPLVPSTSYTFPASASTPAPLRKASPHHHPAVVTPRSSASTSTSRKITPVSSNASSPRQLPVALPLPSTTTPRRSSFFGGGPKNPDSDLSRRPSISMYRRPSISIAGSHSLSPADKTSLRHVGEGALDDSDSSSSGESDDDDDNHNHNHDHLGTSLHSSDDEESGLHTLLSPSILSPTLIPPRNIPAPSPLSRVAGQHRWTEDEGESMNRSEDGDDSSSPSPRSTDTDSPDPSSSSLTRKRKSSKSTSRSHRRHSSSVKSRSRSSTVASLAAPPPLPMYPLTRQDSHSSILTVLADGTPQETVTGGLKHEETIRDLRAVTVMPERQQPSDFVLDTHGTGSPAAAAAAAARIDDVNVEELTERHVKVINDDEKRLRHLTWIALKEALERFADNGDIQMCAMLSVIAPRELQISERRACRFLESYIDLLTRRRLYACSAYLRKYCSIEDVSTRTWTPPFTPLAGGVKKPSYYPLDL
ncbi:hypothetical protein H0H93_010639, partial [Arthromyces matolae]